MQPVPRGENREKMKNDAHLADRTRWPATDDDDDVVAGYRNSLLTFNKHFFRIILFYFKNKL